MITLSDPVDLNSVQPGAFALETWGLKRTAGYGSDHHNTRVLPITAAALGSDRRTITLTIPELAVADCYQLQLKLRGADGTFVERSLHGTIHKLGD
jgi:hypothetical protein